MEKNYFIGLDIGTNSCGFAVTDENYNILRAKGKKLWGVRLFDEANTAEERRLKRGARRRLDRRKMKISWLQEIFQEEMEKVDPKFLTRLKYSNLYLEDKQTMDSKLKTKDSLFFDEIGGEKYTDKEFFLEYPTIYHLRKELLSKPAKDVRLLYLALHNIVKRRGNFLFEANSNSQSLKDAINDLVDFLKSSSEGSELGIGLEKIDEKTEEKIINLLNENKVLKYTKSEIYKIFDTNSKENKRILDVFIDGKIDVGSIFSLDLEEKIKISFQDENFDEEFSNLERILDEEQLTLIGKLKQIYSILQLKKILTKNNYICEAMVELYEMHKGQLKNFKIFVRKYYPSKYSEIFRDPQNKAKKKETNYPVYVDLDSTNGSKQVTGLAHGDVADRTKESFYKFVTNLLANSPEVEKFDEEEFGKEREEILKLIESGNFLPKLRTKNNSIFPNSLYVSEAEKILETNKEKFSFLKVKDDSGLTNAEKILSIIKFRVPYFVGPIGKNDEDENSFGWAQKEQNLVLRPWTLGKIVDFDKAEDAFINKMTNKCTYLYGEDVLPKHSLIYSKFRVLNELNKLRLNGNEISVELKQKIFNDLFKKHKKVTTKLLKSYLLAEGVLDKSDIESLSIGGVDKEFANQLNSFVDITGKGVFDEAFVDEHFEVFENIIKYHTIISDKNRLIARVKRENPGLFNEEQLRAIKSLNYSNWGNLSYKFLCGLKFVNKQTAEITTVLDELWNTNQNLQQIIYNTNYTLGEELSKYNKSVKKDLDYEDVKNLYCSPSVKRAVWQTIQIINEIIEQMNGLPKRVFVEVTRDDAVKGDAGRKLSRQDKLKKIYSSKEFLESMSAMKLDLDELFDELNKSENSSLRSEKLYLYFLQLGKCAYSGQTIDLKDLYDEHKYDVDHIIPQSVLKDDSIDNKVLVKGNLNKDKGDAYPICSKFPNWVSERRPFWEFLLSQNLMSKTKFDRLVRKSPLSDEELGDFISRQLVETNQTVKAVVDILKNKFADQSTIVYSKARFVSEFRDKYKIYKSREINDLHHAKDSYLNIVVGNVLYSRFTLDPRNFYRTDNANKNITKNTKHLFDMTVKSPKGDKIVWNGEKDIERIKKICEKNDCLVSKMNFSNYNGGFYNETRYRSTNNDKDSKAKIQLKGSNSNPLSDISKYGGYDSLKTAYFMLVESEDKNGRKIKTIETVPILVVRQVKNLKDRQEKIFEYVVEKNNLKNAKVLIPKINIQSTLRIGKGEYLLAGKTGNKFVLHNFNQWYLDNDMTRYAKVIAKFIQLKKDKQEKFLEEKDGKVILSKKAKEGNSEIALTRQENVKLYRLALKQLEKDIYEKTSLRSAFYQSLLKNEEKFAELAVKEQAEVLYNILRRMATGASLADLSLLGGGKSEGMITMGKNVTGRDISLVLRSVTGLKERIVKL